MSGNYKNTQITEFNIPDTRLYSNTHDFCTLDDTNKYYITDTWASLKDKSHIYVDYNDRENY